VIALAFGNAMALDFMERVFAARDGRTARRACYYGAFMTTIIGACVAIIALAGVASVQNAADPRMVLPTMAVDILPYWIGVRTIGVWRVVSTGAAPYSISVVLARNVIQRWRPTITEDSKMLRLSRLMALPTAAAAAIVAYVRPEPGILLIIAFDIVFAGCVVPLFAGVYWPKANSAGAVASILVGTTARLIAHYITPAAWAGLDTLIPPVLSAITFYVTCQLTWKTQESRHHVLTGVAQEGIQI
jgi:Na+/proline symporter